MKAFDPSGEQPIIEIAGCGLATPLGTDLPQTWSSLLQGQFIEDHATVSLPPAGGIPHVSQLALHVSREAIGASGWSNADLRDDQTALVIGTSKGPIADWLLPVSTSSPCFGVGQVATDVARELGLGYGPRLTMSAACASGLHALIRAVMLLRSSEARRALVVAVESSVHPLFLASFQRLGVLPKSGIGCRPFDLHRDGFLMSEAAAAVCLERVDRSSKNNRVQVDRFAMGGAAGHLTAGDPDGAVWRQLLARVINHRPVDLVHAHATGTVLNDPIELAAIEDVLDAGEHDMKPVLYSHKGALGHSLGASGLVAVVLSCECHARGQVPPNARLTDPLPTHRVLLSNQSVSRPIRHSVVAASGFGGPTAVVGLI